MRLIRLLRKQEERRTLIEQRMKMTEMGLIVVVDVATEMGDSQYVPKYEHWNELGL